MEVDLERRPNGTRSPRRDPARRCAWCSSFSWDGRTWFQTGLPPRRARREDMVTGGICPNCFARLAPGTPYPTPQQLVVGQANEWLQWLGYAPEEASVAGVGEQRMRLSGRLLAATVEDTVDMELILRMLPAKLDLLRFRAVLGLED